jgi:hypothetical protein
MTTSHEDNNNDDNNENGIVSFKLIDDPINKDGNVESIQKNTRQNTLSINLNHAYKGETIFVPLNPYDWGKDGWPKLTKHIKTEAEARKIPNKIIKYVQNVLDTNYAFIIETNYKDVSDVKDGGKGGGNGDEDEDAAQLLLQLVLPGGLYAQHFFKDQYGKPFCELLVESKDRYPSDQCCPNGNGSHREIVRVESSKYRRYLIKLFYDYTRQVASSEIITNVIQILYAKTEYESETIPLSIRTAWKDDDKKNYFNEWHDSYSDLTSTGEVAPVIYYDMTDSLWHVVKISSDDWGIVESTSADAPIKFTRYNQTPQVMPVHQYPADIFDQFMNLTNVNGEQNKLLLKVYIVSLFVPGIAHVILNLHGEKGSAKTFLMWMIKQLIDPSKPALLTIHKDRDEFIQQLSHNYVAFYDNLKRIPDWLSDEVCKAVTGIGHTKRKLYSNDDDIVYEYKRCPGFNGINVGLTEPDALDRSILIELIRILQGHRRPEAELIQEFERIKPQLLGYIFDVLVETLKIRPTVRLNNLPRMADFALWGEAISRAMGNAPLEFINAYYENIGKQNLEAIEKHPLGQAIEKLYEDEIVNFDPNETGQDTEAMTRHHDREWEGSASELLEKLCEIATKYKIDTQQKDWPKAVNSLTYRFNIIRSNLLEGLGIEVTFRKATTKEDIQKYGRNITIARIRPTSLTSLTSLTSQNHEGKLDSFVNDPSGVKDDRSLIDTRSLTENTKNDAQNPQNNGVNDVSDLGRTHLEEHGEAAAVTGGPDSRDISSNDSSSIQKDVESLQHADSSNRHIIEQIEDFFHDDPEAGYQPLPEHSLEDSPCHDIIDKRGTFYSCKLHPKIRNINLDTMEHHCRYHEPEFYKQEILSRVSAKQDQQLQEQQQQQQQQQQPPQQQSEPQPSIGESSAST